MISRFILYFLLCSITSTLQAKSIDSLLTLLQIEKQAGNSGGQCETHLQLVGAYFTQGQYDLALEHIEDGEPLIPEDRDDLTSHFAYTRYMIYAQQWWSYPSKQIALLDTACLHLEAMGDEELLLVFRPYYANMLILQGQIDKADRQYQLIEELCQTTKYDCVSALAQAYSGRINTQDKLGNYDIALEYVDSTRRNLRGQPISNSLLDSYVSEASVLAKLGEFDLIMPTLNKGLNLALKTEDSWRTSRFYRLKASYTLDQEQLIDSIGHWLALAGRYLAKDPEPLELVELDMTKARHHFFRGEFQQILDILRPHMAACRSESPPPFCRNGCYFVASSFDTLNQPDSALYYGQLGVRISDHFQDKIYSIFSYELLSRLQFKHTNLEDAYHSLSKAKHLTEISFREDMEKAVANERIRQNVAAVEEAQKAAESRADLLATQNRLYIGLSLALGALLLVGGFLLLLLQRARGRLRMTNQKLADLNATKDKFFGLIAHDLRSPFIALSSVGDQMQYYLEQNKPDKLSRLARRVEQSAKGLTSLLDKLLQWALLQTGMIPYAPAEVRLAQVVAENVDLYTNSAAFKSIRVKVDVDEQITTYADPRALSTIIRNLLNNAIKFTPEGGEISISTKPTNRGVELFLSDTGQGMSTEKLNKLFSLEKTATKGTAGEKGAGLGLVIVKELVSLNKGKIEVKSTVGEGTQFRLIFP
ncbi:MAG: HAMP domain-containing sensor histidine kinase [Bacteroidota bacterium]